jgi:phage tail protein X
MPSIYKTRDGDMWDLISYRVYGSEYHLDVLIDANPLFYEATRFEDGDLLTVPDLPADFALPNPPWVALAAR